MYDIKEDIRNNIHQITFRNFRYIYYSPTTNHILYLPKYLVATSSYQSAIRLAFNMKGIRINYQEEGKYYPDSILIRGLTFWQFKKNLLLWTIKDDLDV